MRFAAGIPCVVVLAACMPTLPAPTMAFFGTKHGEAEVGAVSDTIHIRAVAGDSVDWIGVQLAEDVLELADSVGRSDVSTPLRRVLADLPARPIPPDTTIAPANPMARVMPNTRMGVPWVRSERSVRRFAHWHRTDLMRLMQADAIIFHSAMIDTVPRGSGVGDSIQTFTDWVALVVAGTLHADLMQGRRDCTPSSPKRFCADGIRKDH